MDLPEWLSETSPVVWKALRFSTIAVCVQGILGNVSSLTVLGRHLNEIPGSRLLLALGIADLGVVTAVTARILAFVAYGYSRLTKVLEWWFLYCYYCSVYMTILLSVDRYMQSAKSMLLLRINYKRILKIVILSIFGATLLVSLPHLLGNFIKYYHKPHLVIFSLCNVDKNVEELCRHWELKKEQEDFAIELDCTGIAQSVLNNAGAEKYRDRILSACRYQKATNYTSCSQPISVQAPKFTQTVTVHLEHGYKFRNASNWYIRYSHTNITVCKHTTDFMRHDPDFVKALYLGVDLPLRYIIPCVTLAIVNIRLVLAVRRAHIQHAEITGAARVSLLKLPILKTVAAIAFVFLICHTGGSAIFIMDMARTFASTVTMGRLLHGETNILLDATAHTRVLVFKHLGYLLAALNSSINVLVYCAFLPVFRCHWKGLYWPRRGKGRRDPRNNDTSPGVVPWEEVELADDSDGDWNIWKVTAQIRTSWTAIRSMFHFMKENRWVVLRLTLSAVIGILVLVGSGLAVCKSEGTGQSPNYTHVRPVSYRNLGDDHSETFCVTESWLIALYGWSDLQVAHVYSLPAFKAQSKLPDVGFGCLSIRADSEGRVFVACSGRVVMLEISETGNLTFSRNLTAGGRLSERQNTVAVGSKPGQLWVGYLYWDKADYIYLIGVDNDTVIQGIQESFDSNWNLIFFASQLLTGELLITGSHYISKYSITHLYQPAVTLPPTNLTVTGYVRLSHRNHFLLVDWQSNTILVLDSQGDLIHTVDDLNGKHGIWMQIIDVAVWENNLLVCDFNGNVMILSML